MNAVADEDLLDPAQMQALAELGEDYLCRLFDAFGRDARAALERMRDLSRNGARAALAREAHRLKGASGSLGAPLLARGCMEIESGARASGAPGLEPCIAHAEHLLEDTLAALRARLRGTA